MKYFLLFIMGLFGCSSKEPKRINSFSCDKMNLTPHVLEPGTKVTISLPSSWTLKDSTILKQSPIKFRRVFGPSNDTTTYVDYTYSEYIGYNEQTDTIFLKRILKANREQFSYLEDSLLNESAYQNYKGWNYVTRIGILKHANQFLIGIIRGRQGIKEVRVEFRLNKKNIVNADQVADCIVKSLAWGNVSE